MGQNISGYTQENQDEAAGNEPFYRRTDGKSKTKWILAVSALSGAIVVSSANLTMANASPHPSRLMAMSCTYIAPIVTPTIRNNEISPNVYRQSPLGILNPEGHTDSHGDDTLHTDHHSDRPHDDADPHGDHPGPWHTDFTLGKFRGISGLHANISWTGHGDHTDHIDHPAVNNEQNDKYHQDTHNDSTTGG